VSGVGPGQVTEILARVSAGDKQAAETLLPVVYDQLRALARSKMGHVPPGNTLQPTALVHEAYMRLVGDGDRGWDSRGHFFGAAAIAMRDILVEQARRKSRIKAGGGRKREDMAAIDQTPAIGGPEDLGADMIALDGAIKALEAQDDRKAKAVMLKYFAGLEHDQIALALNVSVPTIDRDLRFARAWLAYHMKSSGESA
jgi:RNA polymerase sigma factor (TIGR02999 family)